MNHGSDTRKRAAGYESLERARYESVEGLSRVLLGMLAAAAAVDVVAVVSSGMQLEVLRAGLLRGEQGAGTTIAGLYRENTIGALGLALAVATLPVFAAWIHRAHRNLASLGAKNLGVTPAWAVGWFFMPFANLWMPYQAMRTLWRASQDAPRWQLQGVPWWLALWWVAWVARQALGTAMMSQESSGSAIEAQLQWTEMNMTAHTVGLLLNALAAMLVFRISRAQAAQLNMPRGAEPPEHSRRATTA